MNTGRYPKVIAIAKGSSKSLAASKPGSYHVLISLKHIAYVLSIAFLFTISLANLAAASPVTTDSVPKDERQITPQPTLSETGSIQLGVKEPTPTPTGNEQSQQQSNGEGDFLIGSYNDPGTQKEETNVFVRFLYTIIDIIKYTLYFALVLAIGVLAIYGIKMFTAKYNTLAGMNQGLVNILEIKYLSPGKAICLVEVAGKVLILGMAGNKISPISEITEAEQVETLVQASIQNEKAVPPFQEYLEKITKRLSGMTLKNPDKSSGEIIDIQDIKIGDSTNWRDNLRSTSNDIGKLLEEIKKQDKSKQSRKPDSGKGGGEGDE